MAWPARPVRAGAPAAALLVATLLAVAAATAQGQGSIAPVVPRFVEETASAGFVARFDGNVDEYMVGGGVAAFDCDGDGLPELYVAGGEQPSRFFRNRSSRGGQIQLAEAAAADTGLDADQVTGAYPLDIDGDGRIDLVVLRVGAVQVFRGLGGCRFEHAEAAWGIDTGAHWFTAFSATWERAPERDGAGSATLPTLAFGSYTDPARKKYPWGTCTPTLVLRPQAGGERRYAAPLRLTPGHCALSMLFLDWNRSGHADLRVSNDREYYKNGQEQLWRFRPGEAPRLYTPAEGFKPLQIWGMGIASADLDGDGYPELFLTSMNDNKLQKLDAVPGTAGAALRPSYSDVAYKRGVTAHRPYTGGDVRPSTAWHAQFEDLNHDGWQDLWIVKGNVSTMPDFAQRDPNNLLLGKPDGSFVEVGDQAGIASMQRGRGGQLVDLNGDGLLDMVVVNRQNPAQLWRNVSTGLGHGLQLRLQQPGPNRDAIGAWVEVDLGDRIVRRELTVGGGHASGSLGWVHFGLGSATQVRVRVQWPHSGAWSEWQPIAADQFAIVERDRSVQALKASVQ